MLCHEDTYQDKRAQVACKECGGLKTGSSTFGIIGSFAEEACVQCPEGGECGPGTVRQALRAVGPPTNVSGEVYTAAEYLSANVDSSQLEIGEVLSIAVNDADESFWCPDTCNDCIAPKPGNYRFPPNTWKARLALVTPPPDIKWQTVLHATPLALRPVRHRSK